MLHWFRNKEYTCQLCFRDKRKIDKSPHVSICGECWNAERLRLRSNNRSKRNRRSPSGRISTRQWLMVLEASEWGCAVCKVKGRHKLTLDHIIPINQGGTNTAGNAQPLCVPCHEKKDGYQRRPLWLLRRVLRKWRRWVWKRFTISLPKISLLE